MRNWFQYNLFQNYDKEVTVTCLYNENDGSHWRFKEGDSYKRAKCRRGGYFKSFYNLRSKKLI